jgi:uncharacterized protein (DUF433 family)
MDVVYRLQGVEFEWDDQKGATQRGTILLINIRSGGSAMTASTNGQSTVVRTSRGLSIAGTRITIYALLDYLHADWPPKLVQDWFNLTDQQMADVLAYLAEHHTAVEQEYQQVLRQADANRQYWEARNRERGAQRPSPAASPEQDVLRAKLRAWQSQIRQP